MATLLSSDLSQEQMNAYFRDGFIVVRKLFSKAEVDEIRDTFWALGGNGPVQGISEIRHYNEELPAYELNDPLNKYPRMMHPHRHPELPVGPLSMRIMLDGRIHDILADLFGEEPVAAQSMFYFKPPGARGQALHQDNFYLRVKPGTCMAMWLAVDDADESNGGMAAVPETHHYEIQCPTEADRTKFFSGEHVEPPAGRKPVPINLKAGDVMFFNGSVIHGSNPNQSKDRFRRAFICHYVPQSSTEMSKWYRPLFRFDGSEVEMADAIGGGPCGTLRESSLPH